MFEIGLLETNVTVTRECHNRMKANKAGLRSYSSTCEVRDHCETKQL